MITHPPKGNGQVIDRLLVGSRWQVRPQKPLQMIPFKPLIRDSQEMPWNGWIHMPQPRTALGWNKHYLYLVEVDGRQLDLSLGMTFPQLAKYMLGLGCEQAMNLDGGGSATLWAFGAVKNSPSEGQERPAPNALVVVNPNPPAATK